MSKIRSQLWLAPSAPVLSKTGNGNRPLKNQQQSEEKHRQNLLARKESQPPNGKLLRKNAAPELQDNLGKIFHLILFGCKKIDNESKADIRA